ncbi:Mariner Mos1 transposase [Eumeta japonica]|uniref:Mariner Mos1 transposase n=1 Tax=Eumeta variegata TaxID=151549 RepID=A0A4C1XHX9_EUMVA|nr:Mariner Mos1 transposase [Eumeta japonica]
MCEQLLALTKDDRFIKRIVTCHEKWTYLNNPNKKNQWFRCLEGCGEEWSVLLCIWWSYESLVHFEIIPDGRTMTAKIYCEHLIQMHKVLPQEYPDLVN